MSSEIDASQLNGQSENRSEGVCRAPRIRLTNRVQIFHDPRCTKYGRPGHPERPERIVRTIPLLKSSHSDWQWHEPRDASDEELLRAHSREHLTRIAKASQDFDLDTPAHSKIDFHARQSAGAAIEAARAAVGGKRAFSLMRPPGHHAMRDRAMGFCYFSNIAVTALDALAGGGVADDGPRPTTASTGKIERVAIWDFDAHHGNGTEALVAHNERIMFASIHQYPGWPGTGTKSFENVLNFPIAPYSSRSNHVHAVERALEKLLEFKPQLLLVSAGFDAYKKDPITQMTLEREDFATFGKWLADVKIPTAAILEGGYSDDLPELIDGFLSAWDSPAAG
jgi:acetoin utilization deacetylase AcuC-like enzyme